MKFLSAKELAALSPEDQQKYATDLETFIAEFRTRQDDNGVVTVSADLVNISLMPNNINGKPYHAYTLDIDDESIATGIANSKGVMLRAVGQADVIARNAGFVSHGHMATVTLPCTDKGAFELGVALRVKGDTWSSRDGKKNGVYQKTHLAVETYTYVPSTAVQMSIAKATEKAAASAYEQAIFGGGMQTASPVQAPVQPEPVPADDDVNP